MPKLPDFHIHVEAEDETAFDYKASCSVTTEGEFSVALDERLEGIARALAKNNPSALTIVAGKYRVRANSLNAAISFIKACAKDFLECEVETQRVIVYGSRIRVSFWKDGKDIHPNGRKSGGGARPGQWYKGGGLDSNHHDEYYNVGFAAVVYDKVISKRLSGNVVRYKRLRDEIEYSNTWAEKLNSFVALAVDPDSGDYQEMPYTEEAAMFFYNVMINICKLAESIDSFFGDKNKLTLAIEGGQRFLLGR